MAQLNYRSLHELPIANFHEIIQTGDMRYLYKLPFFDIRNSEPAPDNYVSIFNDMKIELPVFNTMIYEAELEMLYYQCKILEDRCNENLNLIDESIEKTNRSKQAENKNRAKVAFKKLEDLKNKPIAQQSIKERALAIENCFEGKCRMIDIYTIDTVSFLILEHQGYELIEMRRKQYEKNKV